MTLVSALRELWRHRLLVVVGLAVALAAGTWMAFKVSPGLPPTFASRQYEVGIASAGVLIDSQKSQVADLGGSAVQADIVSLSARARLVAKLMTTSPLKDRIARRAGVAPGQLIAIAPAPGPPVKLTPLDTGTALSPDDPRANTVRLNVNEVLPIISADAQAPTAVAAARISTAAVQELGDYLKTVASGDRVPPRRRLVVSALGPAKSATVRRGPRRLFAIVGVIVIASLWCAAILIVTNLARGWRQAAADELAGPAPGPVAAPRDAHPPAPYRVVEPPAAIPQPARAPARPPALAPVPAPEPPAAAGAPREASAPAPAPQVPVLAPPAQVAAPAPAGRRSRWRKSA